jgi:two-component system cell cycle sensor histidine kinase/response regulator CckA
VPTAEEIHKVPTVLVVDDEPTLRKLMQLVLEREGFRVLTAQNGYDAMDVSKSHVGAIDVLVSDVMMPGMDGPTLVDELRETDPNLPVLFVTGSWERVPVHRDEPFPIIEKPFSPGNLVLTIRKLLAQRRH